MKITRNNTIIYEGEFDTALYTKNDLNQEFIDITIHSPYPIIFEKNDVFNYENKDYFLDETSVTAIKENSKNFSFNLKFYPKYYKALEVAFLYENQSVFPFDANLDTLITLLVENLNRVDSGWVKGNVPSTTIRALDFSNNNCIEALATISSVFDMQFSMANKTITLYKSPTNLPKRTLTYPKDFDRVERNIEGRQKIVNKVYATGGTDNLPSIYGFNTLRIDPIQDNNSIAKYGLSEGFYSNPDIKPTTQARITGSGGTPNIIATNDIPYDLNQYIQNNTKPIINFETGQLAGLSFYVKSTVYENGVTVLVIEHTNQGGVTIPNENLKPSANDVFNITNIQQPTEVVQAAENKLRDEALEFLNKRKHNNAQVRIDLTPYGDYVPSFDEKIVLDEPQFDLFSEYFVKSVSKNLNLPYNYMVELTYNKRLLKSKNLIERFGSPNLDLPIYVKLEQVADDVSTKASIESVIAVELTATDALNGVTTLTPKVQTLESDIVNKATIASVTDVDNKVSDNTTAIGTINVELPKKATILALTETDNKATDALNGITTLTPKVTTLETDIVTRATIESVEAVELTATTANTNANEAISEINTINVELTNKASVNSVDQVVDEINTIKPKVRDLENNTQHISILNGKTTIQNELLANGIKLQSGTYKTINGVDGISAKIPLNELNNITVENGLIIEFS